MAGIYLHIPFCASRCIYCGFYSTVGQESLFRQYAEAVKAEIHSRRNFFSSLPSHYLPFTSIKTLYFGGGTPSLFPMPLLRDIVDTICEKFSIDIDKIEEFTMECNPDDITPTLVSEMRALGVNRVSMGVQTFSDDRLRFLRRRHHSSQIAPAVQMLRDGGISNISIDLMFGFPDETLSDWLSDLRSALALRPEHISAYSLMYEEGTPLHRMLLDGKVSEIDEETSRSMYYTLIDTLTAAGYEHYEISNFALPGRRSVHNSNYWRDIPYLGLGASAHSYDLTTRSWNPDSLKDYITLLTSDLRPSTFDPRPLTFEPIDESKHYNDLITTALRTREGIAIDALSEPFRSYLLQTSQEGIKHGCLAIDDGRLHLTREGLYISDDVLSDLIYLE